MCGYQSCQLLSYEIFFQKRPSELHMLLPPSLVAPMTFIQKATRQGSLGGVDASLLDLPWRATIKPTKSNDQGFVEQAAEDSIEPTPLPT